MGFLIHISFWRVAWRASHQIGLHTDIQMTPNKLYKMCETWQKTSRNRAPLVCLTNSLVVRVSHVWHYGSLAACGWVKCTALLYTFVNFIADRMTEKTPPKSTTPQFRRWPNTHCKCSIEYYVSSLGGVYVMWKTSWNRNHIKHRDVSITLSPHATTPKIKTMKTCISCLLIDFHFLSVLGLDSGPY